MSNTISPNMNLVVPTVGDEPGPTWAQDLNADLGIIDRHNHSANQGVQITPDGLNISSDLPFGSNNATMVKTVNFTAQSSSLAGSAPNLGCIYVGGNELYYNDENGNVVQITNSGNVNAGAGSISGLPSGTASATFSAATFIWQSATATPATMDNGPVIIRNPTASAKGVTLSPVNALGADYDLVLPQLPGSTSFMTLDTAGNMGASISTTQGIITSMIADANVTQAKLQVRTVGTLSVPAGGVAISSGSGSFSTASASPVDVTNLTVSLVTTGRPVMIMVQPDSGANGDFRSGSNSAGNRVSGKVYILRNGVSIGSVNWDGVTNSNSTFGVPGNFVMLDTPGASTVGYKVQLENTTGTFAEVDNCVLVVYET